MSRLARLRWRLRGDPPRPWAAILLAAIAMTAVAYLGLKLGVLARSTLAFYGLLGGVVVGLASRRVDRAALHAAVAAALVVPAQVLAFAADDLVMAARYDVVIPPMTFLPPDRLSRLFLFVVFESFVTLLYAVPAFLGALVGAVVVVRARQVLAD